MLCTFLLRGVVFGLFYLSEHALGLVQEKDITALRAACLSWNSDPNFCNEQCTKMAHIANQRICRSRSLSKLYSELKHCENKHAGICKWFRCRCFNPSEPKSKISLGSCKRRLAKYYTLNQKQNTLGFEDY